MTFSLCVREPYKDDEETEQCRFGVAVTTRLPAVGTLCPFANEHGAVATQSLVNVDLGRRGVEYLADGLAIEGALEALLNADDGRSERQLHGVDRDGEFAFSGDECNPWYGHRIGDDYTVAGNLLVGEPVLEETARAYEDADETEPLSSRLVEALAAGHAAGGDKRTERRVQSAAIVVTSTGSKATTPFHDHLRVDATESPIADLRETYELAREAWLAAADTEDDEAVEDGGTGESDDPDD